MLDKPHDDDDDDDDDEVWQGICWLYFLIKQLSIDLVFVRVSVCLSVCSVLLF